MLEVARGFVPERGQASVELVAVLPLVLLTALVVWQLALTGHALWSAATAARVAARAAAIGEDEGAAARRALPSSLERGLRVEREEGVRVRVHVRPPLVVPGRSALFSVSAAAALEARR